MAKCKWCGRRFKWGFFPEIAELLSAFGMHPYCSKQCEREAKGGGKAAGGCGRTMVIIIVIIIILAAIGSK